MCLLLLLLLLLLVALQLVQQYKETMGKEVASDEALMQQCLAEVSRGSRQRNNYRKGISQGLPAAAAAAVKPRLVLLLLLLLLLLLRLLLFGCVFVSLQIPLSYTSETSPFISLP